MLVRDPAPAGAMRATAERLELAPRIVGGFPDVALPAADVVVSTLPAGAADPWPGAPGTRRPWCST